VTRDHVCGAPAVAQLTVQPGVNEVVAIARGHLNRLVTPFEQPRATTVSEATVQVKGRVVYVAPATEEPVALFLTAERSEAIALSLTLVPCAMPPRELTLRLAGADLLPPARLQVTPASGNPAALRRDPDQALKQVALEQVPPGYTLRAWQGGDQRRLCSGGPRHHSPPVMEGQRLLILVARARNRAGSR